MFDQLNTYEKAKPSLDTNFLWFRGFRTDGNSTDSGLCSDQQTTECLLLILGVSTLFFTIAIILTCLLHLVSNWRKMNRLQKFKSQQRDVPDSSDAMSIGRVDQAQIFEDIVNH